MGTSGAARVDTAAVRAIAREYETAASILDSTVRHHLSGLAFDGATAGRAHVAHGDALRDKLSDVVTTLREWSRAAQEIAAALRASADRYQAADLRAAERLG
ncbi:ESX-1 secretion-associated protein [Mycobacterium sp. 4D054]|uniref:ESX-1 secretion-associated protein n=1 Tax=unclassified Mycobacterium TaxID=2642494 RepID=UPI0021B3491B|nr:ESX-1 secretion-associated protein [Mycobacterium sp. SMC-8]UXA14758.1 ESX-1 secretion-associated protein [Mycobacterium sp. SMC-8]